MTTRPAWARPPAITVLVLDDEFSGALAYALECALFAPSTVRAVAVASAAQATRPTPIPVTDLSPRRPAEALVRLSDHSACMVAQCLDGAADDLVVTLRRTARCPLVEVDGNAAVLRISLPREGSLASGEAGVPPG